MYKHPKPFRGSTHPHAIYYIFGLLYPNHTEKIFLWRIIHQPVFTVD